ncbi:MAG: sel1 repeat family protein [Erysipelotrichaceae bacterium]|nr:sel1 repeat family protein [Erysipelotrichaceae bacterium]
MAILDIDIVKAVMNVMDEYGDGIRYDYDRFEEALNDEAPQLMGECYLVVLGMKSGIFDVMIFDENISIKGYKEFMTKHLSLSEQEAVFLVAVLQRLLGQMGYYFTVSNMDELVEQSFKQGDLEHLAMVAKCYYDGFGIEQDYEKAFQIYSYLYGLGYQDCAYYLGDMYEHGYGVEVDKDKAIMFYESHEDDQTCLKLGMMHLFGLTDKKDLDIALEYFQKSHVAEAYFYSGCILEYHRRYSSAFQAFYQGARMYDRHCLYKAATYLKTGLGVEKDKRLAQQYFEYGYYLYDGDCTYELALLQLEHGIYEKEKQIGIHYLKQAVDMHSQIACITLAQFYYFGQFVKSDKQKGDYYLKKAYEIESENQRILKEYAHEDL